MAGRLMIGNAFAIAVACVAAAPATGMDETLAEGFRLTFEETFERLDASASPGSGARWYIRTPWGGDFGKASFAGALTNGTFSVEDGVLTIALRKHRPDEWTTGLLSSVDSAGNGFTQQYGYFEIRARLPEGAGVWPAFWLIGIDRLDPASQITAEIDVMEHYGAMPDAFSSKWHVWHRDGSGRHDWGYQRKTVPAGQLSRDFHSYAVLVTAETTTFYFDGEPHWSAPTPPGHRQPMMILTNLAAGGGWPVTDEADGALLMIDHIRVYEQIRR